MNVEILLGKTREHLVPVEGTKFFLHKQVLHDFLKLKRDAEAAGFNLEIASSFRDYERQALIWNAKARGERALFDDQGLPLEFSKLSPREIMLAILRWSAVPGASRHHWGSDLDVFDANKQLLDEVKLIPSECEGEGPSSGLHAWLDEAMSTQQSHGFYRPYRTDRGGVASERWHLSHFPISRRMQDVYTFSIFKKNLEESELVLKNDLLENAHEIFERFFLNVDLP
jgi:LAS superfamily LD-carboxypeptidase LdcB